MKRDSVPCIFISGQDVKRDKLRLRLRIVEMLFTIKL